MRFDGKDNKQRATKLSIGELSGVTIPAVQGSVSTIRKYAADTGDNELQTLFKATFAETLTEMDDAERGRELLEDTYEDLWRTQDALFTSMRNIMHDEQYGDTPEQRADVAKQQIRDYAMTLLTGAGLTQKIKTNQPDHDNLKSNNQLPSGINKQAEDDMSKIEELEKALAEQTALAGMTDAHKSHYTTLTGENREAFAKMSTAEREATSELAKAADESYTMTDGSVICKSVMGTMYDVVKGQDEKIAKMEAAQNLVKFTDMAKSDEYMYLPGEPLAKALALKSCADDATVLAMLKAGNAALKPSFVPAVHKGADVLKNAEDQLDTLAKAYAEKHEVTFAKGYDAVLNTKEGADLYNETVGA